jgi:hypothetical protein
MSEFELWAVLSLAVAWWKSGDSDRMRRLWAGGDCRCRNPAHGVANRLKWQRGRDMSCSYTIAIRASEVIVPLPDDRVH